ncbi:MAG: 3TM-type holin [Geminicoccaceae bacterium]
MWSWFGIGKEIATPVDALGQAVDSIFTSDEERLDKQAVLEKIRTSPYLAALQISMLEAKSKDPFVARARPLVLYTFCAVFFIQNGLLPVLWWTYQSLVDITVPPPPSLISMDMFMTVVAGVLGTSWIAGRSVEKISGKER